MTEGPEGSGVDPRLLAMDLPGLRALADQMYGGEGGPLDVAVPDGSPAVRTASGRPVDVAMTSGALPPGVGTVPVASTVPPAGEPRSVPTGWSVDPRVLEMARRLMSEEATLPPSAGTELPGPPPGYRPPQDPSRDPVVVFRRLLAMAPEALANALPTSTRERSVVKKALDDARLWFEEAVRLAAERETLGL